MLAPRGASERLAQAYLRQGDLLTLLKRFNEADRALSTSLRLSRERHDAALERHVLRSIGLLRWHEGRYPEALAITDSALEIDRERHDELAVAGDLANRGQILKCMGEYELARASLEEAIAIPAQAAEPATLTYNLHMLANICRSQGDLDSAYAHLQRADEISRRRLRPILRSFHLMGIAHVLLQRGEIEQSLRAYEESVETSRRSRHADGLVQSLRAQGEVLLGLGRYAEALPPLQEAARLFAQLGDQASGVEMLCSVAIAAGTHRHAVRRPPDLGRSSPSACFARRRARRACRARRHRPHAASWWRRPRRHHPATGDSAGARLPSRGQAPRSVPAQYARHPRLGIRELRQRAAPLRTLAQPRTGACGSRTARDWRSTAWASR